MVALQLAERGFFVREMNVGWHEWVAEGLPVKRAEARRQSV
jgi:hypothetical protein